MCPGSPESLRRKLIDIKPMPEAETAKAVQLLSQEAMPGGGGSASGMIFSTVRSDRLMLPRSVSTCHTSKRQASASLGATKPSPATAVATPNPHSWSSAHCFPAHSCFEGLPTPARYTGSIARAGPASSDSWPTCDRGGMSAHRAEQLHRLRRPCVRRRSLIASRTAASGGKNP